MSNFINFKDPESPETGRVLEQVPRCPGICFFIDITQSTMIKYSHPISVWGRQLNNTFNFISLLNDFPDNIVKGIGDELMLYIPDGILEAKKTANTCYALLEEIYATIFNLKNYPIEGLFLNCKVAIHYCTEAYNITFLRHFNDYYGSDIDLTSRLMTKGIENRIVLSEVFYRKVTEDLDNLGLPHDSGCMSGISGKISEQFRGVPCRTDYRIIDV
jgi:class 3 adenylate cyclase